MTTPDGVSPGWRATLSLLARLPQGALSRATGRLADVPVPRSLRSAVYGAFASRAGIDLSEAGQPLEAYATFDDFFTRRLKPGLREWPADPAALASPVDGTVGQLGIVRDGHLLQAKGRPYTVSALLDDEAEAGRYDNGSFLTLYLSPKDYHRIHAPRSGTVSRVRHVPGALLPVNEPAIRSVPGLFPRNERVVCYLDGDAGRIAVVAVGAFNVGRIEVVFDPAWRSNRRGATARDVEYDPAHAIAPADELMVFHLGSTVVLLFEAGRARLDAALTVGDDIRLGSAIGTITG